MICYKCQKDKDQSQFDPGHKQCRQCKNETQYKRIKKEGKVMSSEYNDMKFVVGLFLGEYSGLKVYMK